MYPDAFTIQRLANELQLWLANTTVKSIFSVSKTDIFFVFNDKKGFKVQFFQGQAFFQFPDLSSFPLKNRFNQFGSVHNSSLVSISHHLYSRSFDMLFSNQQRLVFKIFGKHSNIILYDQHGIAISLFNNNYSKDLSLNFNEFIKSDGIQFDEYITPDLLKTKFKSFSTDSIQYLKNIHFFNSAHQKIPYENFVNQYQKGELYLIKKADKNYELSCFDQHGLIESYTSFMDAIGDFTSLFIASESFKAKKTQGIDHISKQIKQKQKLYLELNNSIERIKQKRSYHEFGDLIMANLQHIHIGTEQVELFDFYLNSKTVIKIKSHLSPQKNAELFYQKAKNQVKELEFKVQALEATRLQIEILQNSLNTLNEVESLKNLKSFNSTIDPNSMPNKQISQASVPYKSYKIEGYEILVGKNAKSNDELITKFASKNDLWLHAKDVSGSHVIIKSNSINLPPINIIEQVASLAAWYSKARNSSLATVIYTLRKFVRKPKGAPPGLVLVEREKSILVKPNPFTEKTL